MQVMPASGYRILWNTCSLLPSQELLGYQESVEFVPKHFVLVAFKVLPVPPEMDKECKKRIIVSIKNWGDYFGTAP